LRGYARFDGRYRDMEMFAHLDDRVVDES